VLVETAAENGAAQVLLWRVDSRLRSSGAAASYLVHMMRKVWITIEGCFEIFTIERK
jgi:hypothetical protein